MRRNGEVESTDGRGFSSPLPPLPLLTYPSSPSLLPFKLLPCLPRRRCRCLLFSFFRSTVQLVSPSSFSPRVVLPLVFVSVVTQCFHLFSYSLSSLSLSPSFVSHSKWTPTLPTSLSRSPTRSPSPPAPTNQPRRPPPLARVLVPPPPSPARPPIRSTQRSAPTMRAGRQHR